MVVYDATQPVEEHCLGPGRPVIHAWPDGSRVALCGKTRTDAPIRIDGTRCKTCEREAGRKSFIGR